jgi:hypothetical protein
MSRKFGILTLAAVCLASVAVFVAVRPAQGAKPSSPLSLKANFEGFWQDGTGGFIGTRIHNDVEGLVYPDTADTKRIKYGIEVKYYPPGSGDTRGRFVMKIDRAAALGRYVRLHFGAPLTGSNCVSAKEGCGVDGFLGDTGEVETRSISISTQLVMIENAAGALVRDVNAPIGMDTMKTGDKKVVGLGISFTPDNPNFDYQYDLGQFTDPGNYIPGLTCQEQNYPWGPAELYCVAAGQVWEFRPCSKAYVNEPNSARRLLWGRVLLDYWTFCRLNKWEMPFVLRVTR